MPLIDKRSTLTPANARASDVAQAMTEHVAPMQQQRMLAAFRVQGFECIHYSRLQSGIKCSCKSGTKLVQAKLGDDGQVDVGTINKVLTGEARFGIGAYNPMSPDAEFEDVDNFHDAETSPHNAMNQWLGDLRKAGPDNGVNNLITDQPLSTETGEFSPDFDELFRSIDLDAIGLTDVSCPLCFGSGYIGGFSPFRGWRQVIGAQDLSTTSTLDLTTNPISMRPGTHQFMMTLPHGAVILDVFRAMNGDEVIPAQITIDGTPLTTQRMLSFFDGQPHLIQVQTEYPMTHFEAQAGLSTEPVYFEFPKRGKTQDIALLERSEPFQIMMSPDCPQIETLDVIADTVSGKFLIVGNVDPWQTRNRQFLGQNVQVRVAQPQELWRILPQRTMTWNKTQTANLPAPSKSQATSGLVPGMGGFSF